MDIINYWHWWIFAVVFIILEIFVPGTAFFLWMGIAAAVVGLVMVFVPSLGWEYQFILFAVFAIVSIALWRLYFKKNPSPTDHPTLNRRGQQYIGRVFTLEVPIVNGIGKIKVDDSIWKISGDDCDAGTKVKVIDIDGTIFKVECLTS